MWLDQRSPEFMKERQRSGSVRGGARPGAFPVGQVLQTIIRPTEAQAVSVYSLEVYCTVLHNKKYSYNATQSVTHSHGQCSQTDAANPGRF